VVSKPVLPALESRHRGSEVEGVEPPVASRNKQLVSKAKTKPPAKEKPARKAGKKKHTGKRR
jgi:hypothetical protein